MKNLARSTLGIATFTVLIIPSSFAFAATVLVQNLSPGDTIFAKSNVWFTMVTSGFSYPVYHISDSFPNSTASVNNIDPGGRFSWTPSVYDVGTHTLTLSVTDNDGNSASATQSITVSPPPSISINSVSPGTAVMPGTKVTFVISSTGFTNPRYIIGDVAANPSVTSSNIDASGNFSWKPEMSDNGEHVITIYANDTLGHSDSKSITIRVGAGPSITVSSVTPGTSVNPGQTITFGVGALNFSPSAFSLVDSFSGTTSLSNGNINASGQFVWTPGASDVGTHVVTITGTVGAFGTSASTTQTLTVLGQGGTTATSSTANIASMTALIALQAKLAALQSAIASQSGSADVAPVSSGFSFTKYLHPGSTGMDVMELQKMLAKEGYFTVEPNGNYGPITGEAVARFQAAHGLDQLAVVGPATRAALNAILETALSSTLTATAFTGTRFVFEHFMGVGDDDDPDVVELQKRLRSEGYLTGTATGYYGSVTEAAVKKFQAAHSQPATGYVNKVTRAALNK